MPLQIFLPGILLRLVGNDRNGAGRVEANIAGVWGTINQRDWGLQEARVVCRQLNYSDAIAAIHRASAVWLIKRPYTKETPEWIRSVRCNGSEEAITDCRFKVQQMPNYGNDAGVICQVNGKKEGSLSISFH